MTDNTIRTIVKETVNDLLGRSMLKYSDLIIYDIVGERLRKYYKGAADPIIEKALKSLSNHPYYEVLEMYYKSNFTLEAIANDYDVDISTITRNKKNLCIKIFDLIN